MMASKLTIITMIDSGSRKVLKMQGKWSGNGVELLLNDGESTWTGIFSLNEVDEQTLSQLELGRDQYMERVKSALGTTTVNKYKYTFEADSLTWAKIVTPDFSILHGRISFKLVPDESYGELVGSLMDTYGSVLEELSESVARYNRLEREYEEINKALEECIRMKTEMEITLYGRFAMLLNEKKEYVRRVTGVAPTENFGPTPTSSPQSEETSRETISVPLKDLTKETKRRATGERPSKKPMLDSQPTSSTDDVDDMEM